MTTWHHEERLKAVQDVVRDVQPARVLDLGCGAGDLFVRLAADPGVAQLVGLDLCTASLTHLRGRLATCAPVVPRIDVREMSMTDPTPDLAGFDCAILLETIEHIGPDEMTKLERALFRTLRPTTIVITTPNAEFNPLLGVPPHRMRHPGHRFEWTRAQFRRWGMRVAGAAGYAVRFRDIAGHHPTLGGASQMAVFQMSPADAG